MQKKHLVISHIAIYKPQNKYMINILYRQTALLQSPLASGDIPAYYTIDVQVTWRIPEIKAQVKMGATNLLNRRYFQYAEDPEIGGLYYLAFTYDLKL
ncbi:TonB-dependent receptor [Chryseobacterium daecheongense]|uniref:TonB-dependent receptor n=1 Tax=Chryseobacterium daecheongense TaxID=192389 RepID=UPI001FD6AD20|nr:TonB-dependent receptor [Chryseobacterium daecheongense]UOV00151.1 TonB-dependent receptor [Chryseobacterium daecheongense]